MDRLPFYIVYILFFVIFQIAKESFPPCMRHLHETLRKEHHLKHFARLQYGLFLKSIGLTLEQALALWREEFVKKMDPDKVHNHPSGLQPNWLGDARPTHSQHAHSRCFCSLGISEGMHFHLSLSILCSLRSSMHIMWGTHTERRGREQITLHTAVSRSSWATALGKETVMVSIN